MKSMEISYQLSPDDLASYQYAVRNRLARGISERGDFAYGMWAMLLAALTLAVIAAATWYIPHFTARPFAVPEMIAGFILGMAVLMATTWLSYFRQRHLAVTADGPTLSPHAASLEPDGLRVSGQNFEHTYLWSIFSEVSELKTIIVLWIEPGQGLVIPRSAFADPETASAVINEIKGLIANPPPTPEKLEPQDQLGSSPGTHG